MPRPIRRGFHEDRSSTRHRCFLLSFRRTTKRTACRRAWIRSIGLWRPSRIPIEVIVVNNNSRDATPQIAQDFSATHPYARVLHQPRQGKGAAVQMGMLNGAGEYLFICDADSVHARRRDQQIHAARR